MIMRARFHFVWIVLFISSMPATGQIDASFHYDAKKAFNVSTPAEIESSLKFCNEALKVFPDHPLITYLAARLNALLGNNDIALEQLKKASRLGYTSSVRVYKTHQMNDHAFDALRGTKEFEEIIAIMKQADKPIHGSQIAFTVKDKNLTTEGITYDPVDKMFYLGSDHRIIKVDHSGKSVLFTKEARKDGLGTVNGIRVDPVRRTLWACSNAEDRAEIFRYSLPAGKLIRKYTVMFDGTRHFFNDLVLHPRGDVYISDSLDSAIYVISSASDELEVFLKEKLFITGLNGITLSEDGEVLFVSCDNLGIYRIEIKAKSFAMLSHEKDFHTYGIDGLYFAEKYLYAIQNVLLAQVSRFKLNRDATHLESCEILEKNTSDLRGPTTGVMVDDYFYFIADAGREQRGVVIMRAPLRKRNRGLPLVVDRSQ